MQVALSAHFILVALAKRIGKRIGGPDLRNPLYLVVCSPWQHQNHNLHISVSDLTKNSYSNIKRVHTLGTLAPYAEN